MPKDEKRWTVTFHRGEASLCGGVWALAASQKAAEVEMRTESLLFRTWLRPPLWNALRCDPAPSERRGLCFCLTSAHLLGNLDAARLCLQQESLNQIPAGQPNSSAMLFPVAVPQLPVCLCLHSWDAEESLLGFLRDDCCLLNNLAQPQKAQSSEGQRQNFWATVTSSNINPVTLGLPSQLCVVIAWKRCFISVCTQG